jgi:hypothetical protein
VIVLDLMRVITNLSGKKMNRKYIGKFNEYLDSYKIQLKFAPKYKDKQFTMNPVYYQLMGKIDLLEKLIKDFEQV